MSRRLAPMLGGVVASFVIMVGLKFCAPDGPTGPQDREGPVAVSLRYPGIAPRGPREALPAAGHREEAVVTISARRQASGLLALSANPQALSSTGSEANPFGNVRDVDLSASGTFVVRVEVTAESEDGSRELAFRVVDARGGPEAKGLDGMRGEAEIAENGALRRSALTKQPERRGDPDLARTMETALRRILSEPSWVAPTDDFGEQAEWTLTRELTDGGVGYRSIDRVRVLSRSGGGLRMAVTLRGEPTGAIEGSFGPLEPTVEGLTFSGGGEWRWADGRLLPEGKGTARSALTIGLVVGVGGVGGEAKGEITMEIARK